MITYTQDGRLLIGAMDSIAKSPFQIISEDGEILVCVEADGFVYYSPQREKIRKALGKARLTGINNVGNGTG